MWDHTRVLPGPVNIMSKDGGCEIVGHIWWSDSWGLCEKDYSSKAGK